MDTGADTFFEGIKALGHGYGGRETIPLGNSSRKEALLYIGPSLRREVVRHGVTVTGWSTLMLKVISDFNSDEAISYNYKVC